MVRPNTAMSEQIVERPRIVAAAELVQVDVEPPVARDDEPAPQVDVILGTDLMRRSACRTEPSPKFSLAITAMPSLLNYLGQKAFSKSVHVALHRRVAL